MKLGDRVICIDGRPWKGTNTGTILNGPKLNEIVTIRGFKEGSLLFEEYKIINCLGREIGYWRDYFRPLNLVDSFDSEAYLEWLEKIIPELEPIEK